MNARQAARAASKRIADLEITLDRAMSDIKRYNQVIDSMIAGGSPCDYCEDLQECQLEAKGTGCDLWMLSYEDLKARDDKDNEGERILSAGCSSGTED